MIKKVITSASLSTVNDLTSSNVITDITTSELNKLWRAKVLTDRITRPIKMGTTKASMTSQEKAATQNTSTTRTKADYTNHTMAKSAKGTTANRTSRESEVSQVEAAVASDPSFITDPSDLESRKAKYTKRSTVEKQKILLFNLSSNNDYLEFQTYPSKISHQSESTWAIINSMGRNVPMYHFTGAETIIQMALSWYCDDKNNPGEVLYKCKLLESWSKANGYIASPPILQFQWGNSDLFQDEYFILTSANYELSHWRNTSKVWSSTNSSFQLNEGYSEPNLLPSVATQELVFRRVSATNLTHEDIIKSTRLTTLKGYNKNS